MIKTFHTACPRNCYSTCSFIVKIEDQTIFSIDPQILNLATSEGPCLKGLAYKERAHSKDRILYPLRKKDGTFTRISWEEALDKIVEKLNHYKANYGSHSILFYAASGMSGMLNAVSSDFWRLFGGTTTVYGNLCWPAGLEASRLTLGENKHNAPWDIENAKLIVLWGKNPAESNIHQMLPIEKAQRKGAKLIVIDPRRTPSSERADLLLQPIPGTDGILALAVAKIIIARGNHDIDFIEKQTLGFPEFMKSLEEINLEQASQECGIPIYLIEKLADLMGNIQPMTLVPGYGMQRYTNGGQSTRCILALSIITGNIGKKGACWHYANLQSYVFDKVKEPVNYFPSEADQPFRRSIPTALLGEKMMEQKNPELKMAWVERGNPITQNPDSNKTIAAFKNLDFVVVVEQFLTDTALEADLILPAKNMFEQSDIIGSYWNPYVQLKQKVMEPAGEVKPETEIYYLLAQKLGFSEEDIKKHFPEPNDEAIEKYLNKELEAFDELTFEKLKEGPVLAPGLEEIAFEDMKFNTPSGKIELFSQQAFNKWEVPHLPTYERLEEGQKKANHQFPLSLMSPNTKNRIHSQFGNLESINVLDPEPILVMSPKDARARGIKQDEQVKVWNLRGEVIIKIRFDHSLRPGNVVMVNGYWNSEGGSPNLLSKGRETDMGHGTAFHDNMVEVEKI
ncbi:MULTISPECIES: molybdopterin-dependent oxidoreductase [unclassified Lentimicrobium]|uniref:molybdopterin-containing oxidoreductase family protein n=1 Tax=unclassified Lentimicrobium TaxID=2677434 RepID=UPI0015581611|nr:MULTISPECIES: molybdopterin-dependent oxidoreductase [unclassified Lentimicrobium]NPD44865.1 molybdopterin-dependent oxidoreductase [Lentimicrobium sp. S6]NPD83691.1 molybdopterin-dependent oxidoreductase [Lentimicrobium sp. L6]